MGVDIDSLTNEADGAYPEATKGWQQNMRLESFKAEAKGARTWFLLKFAGADGFPQASASLNLFSKPEDDGKKVANRITLGVFKSLWDAAGLDEATYPAPNARDMAKALNAYEGSLVVDAYCGPDDKGYTQATKFRKASGAAA